MACDEMERMGKGHALKCKRGGILITAHLTSTKLIAQFCWVTNIEETLIAFLCFLDYYITLYLFPWVKPGFCGFYLYKTRVLLCREIRNKFIINSFVFISPAFPWGDIKSLSLLLESYPYKILLRTVEIRENLN